MRTQLAHLVGKVVCWRGWEVGSRKEGTYSCVQNVRLNVWDWDEGIYHCAMRKPGIFVDHLWMCHETYNRASSKNLYRQLMGVARIKPYTRANGSRDLSLSVKNINLYSIDEFIEEQNRMHEAGTPDDVWIPWYRAALKRIAKHEKRKNVICYGSNRRVSKIKSFLQEELAMMENSRENVRKRLETATMNGSCDQLRSLDLTANLTSRKSKAVGF